jgi:hypothetical protein
MPILDPSAVHVTATELTRDLTVKLCNLMHRLFHIAFGTDPDEAEAACAP